MKCVSNTLGKADDGRWAGNNVPPMILLGVVAQEILLSEVEIRTTMPGRLFDEWHRCQILGSSMNAVVLEIWTIVDAYLTDSRPAVTRETHFVSCLQRE